MPKINTPTKTVHKQLFSDSDEPAVSVLEQYMDITCVSDQTDIPTVYECQSEDNMVYNIDEEIIDNTGDIPVFSDEEHIKQAIQHLQTLPSVTSHMVEHNRLNDWLAFLLSKTATPSKRNRDVTFSIVTKPCQFIKQYHTHINCKFYNNNKKCKHEVLTNKCLNKYSTITYLLRDNTAIEH